MSLVEYLRVRNGRRGAVHLNPSIEAHDAPGGPGDVSLAQASARGS